jgi:DNA polymerase V
MAARFEPQAQREEARASAASKQFPMHDESVAAGMPAWAGCAEAPLGTSIWDIVEQSDPSTTMWVLVSGWSMRDVGINDGDTVLVDTTREARSGDIVVVHIAGDGQVVKRIRMMPGDPIVLESANPDFAPRVINDALSLRIHGVVVGRVGKL